MSVLASRIKASKDKIRESASRYARGLVKLGMRECQVLKKVGF